MFRTSFAPLFASKTDTKCSLPAIQKSSRGVKQICLGGKLYRGGHSEKIERALERYVDSQLDCSALEDELRSCSFDVAYTVPVPQPEETGPPLVEVKPGGGVFHLKDGESLSISITCTNDTCSNGTRIRYTLDGQEPNQKSHLYRKCLSLSDAGTWVLTTASFHRNGRKGPSTRVTFTIKKVIYRLPHQICKGVLSVFKNAQWCEKNLSRFKDALAHTLGIRSHIQLEVKDVTSEQHASRSSCVQEPRVQQDLHWTVELNRNLDKTTAESLVKSVNTDGSIGFTARIRQRLQGLGLKMKKGDFISKPVTACYDLRGAALNLSWGFPGAGDKRDYLDAVVMCYQEENLLDIVDYRGAMSGNAALYKQQIGDLRKIVSGETKRATKPRVSTKKTSKNACSSEASPASMSSKSRQKHRKGRLLNEAIVHSGDVMTTVRGTHSVQIDLMALPACVTDIYLLLSAYNCGDISLFSQPRLEIFDCDHPSLKLTQFDPKSAGKSQAVIMACLVRQGASWNVEAYGQACKGTVRNYTPLKSAIAPFQKKHAFWRKRGWLLMLEFLWDSNRAVQEVGKELDTNMLIQLFELPLGPKQKIFEFL